MAPAPPITPDFMTSEEFAKILTLDRTVLARLESYADLLKKWQSRINLIGRATLPDLWRRHMLDSAQLIHHIPSHRPELLDFGSGAGFPGLVLAILGVADVHLVESDARKCAFLREAARVTETKIHLHHLRIEHLDNLKPQILTARACAPLKKLLELSEPFLIHNPTALFLKGKTVEQELTDSRKNWTIASEVYPSRSDPTGVILKLRGISRYHGHDESKPNHTA